MRFYSVKQSLTPTTYLGDVAAVPKISHQWFETLTPNNTKRMGRMTCHCFQRAIRRDLRISCYTTDLFLHVVKAIASQKTRAFF